MSGNRELLASVPLFAKLPKKTIERLDRIAVEREFPAGTEMVKEGEAGVGFFLIVDGVAEVRHAQSTSPVRTLIARDFFGDMSLLDGHPRSATVAAIAPTRCLVMTRWDFLAEVRQNPEVAIELLETLSLRVRELEGLLVNVKQTAAAGSEGGRSC